MIKKGSWVLIHKTLLAPEQRTGRLPAETQATPFDIWTKGRLLQDANIGDTVMVYTRTGRQESGVLEQENPAYELGYGAFVEELLQIGEDARNALRRGTL